MRTIPDFPHPSSVAVDDNKRFSREWFDKLDEFNKAVQQRMPIPGTVTFASATTAAVTFATPLADANYSVHYDAPEDRRVWTTSKTASGFTANVSASSSATYGYTVVRR